MNAPSTEEETKEYPQLKIVIIGESSVGKSAIINQYINQIFIDNLNADNKITLKDLLEVKNIKEIAIKLKDELKLDYQFNKSLTNFLREELEKTSFDEECKEEYIREIVD